jgi:hypothetical protein
MASLSILILSAAASWAASIAVPNGSFELQSAAGQPQGVNINIDSWQKAPKPAYFDAIETNFGIFWVQTAGVFVDPSTNAYINRDGAQAAYMLAFNQISLSQVLTSPGATYDVGMSYTLTLGVYGKQMLGGETLQLSLYYLDSLNNPITVGTPTTVTFSTATFPGTGPFSLIDYSTSSGEVLATDPWAGKNVGLRIESVSGVGQGYWDMDNARLTVVPVPEPSTIALLTLGVGGCLLLRGRCRPG